MGSPNPSGQGSSEYDYSFKVVMLGDSGVGKSSLLHSFVTGAVTYPPPSVGIDIKTKQITLGGKRLKLSIWDTAGQERFRTLTSHYYRDSHGFVLVYDVTQKQTFTNVVNLWAKEMEIYSTNKDSVKILVGNKVDRESERVVSREEAMEVAKQNGFLFLESSARTRANVEKCFEDVALKLLEGLEKKRLEELENKRQDERKQEQPEPKLVDIKEPKPKSPEKKPSYPGPPGGGGGNCCH